ncbi:MAG: ribonuclease HII [Candidatus Aminicenantaceae bacterium]
MNNSKVPDFKIEQSIIQKKIINIAGIDEAGRGAIFGPVVAAAVSFPDFIISGKSIPFWAKEINDSKILSPEKRKKVARLIVMNAKCIGVGFVSNFDIDRKNIYQASLEAMVKAVKNMSVYPDYILVDGYILNDVNCIQKRVIKGDTKSISIAAASIIAKTLRDEMIIRLDQIYEGYYLSKNKGYGTREHYMALKRKGATAFHRWSFNLKK